MSKKIIDASTDAASCERITADAEKGLTEAQAKQRMDAGLYNKNTQPKGKSVKRIFYDNIVTLFNIMNIILGISVFIVGSYKNMLFLGVMFFNTTIGIVQEIRAKKAIDKLSIVSASKADVIRDGQKKKIGTENIVLDDIIEFTQGNQIPVDSVLISGECDVNESLLTGESDAIHKKPGDMILSGSFIVSGRCFARAEHVGADNYAAKISAEAKYIKKINSEIMITLETIIKILAFVIIPLTALLFLRQYFVSFDSSDQITSLFGTMSHHFQSVVVSCVASVTSIIPEGLMLLTSTVLAVSVIRLAQHKVLVQELYCIETLARVDVLCLDKTGTITEGCMEVADVIPYGDCEKDIAEDALRALTGSLDDTNATFTALYDKYGGDNSMKADRVIPFASEKKWSGAHYPDAGSYIMGAAEFILGNVPEGMKKLLESYSRNYRCIIIAHSDNDFRGKDLPDDIRVIGLALLNDKIRKEAPDTLRYFADQNVEVKIISGDNPITVSDVARRAEVLNYDRYVDATTLKTDEEIADAIENYTVFGRVTPAQKKKFVLALKDRGHTVAMTGDGVNDVLALKEADCSIAMAAGSDAARSVSQLVLLDSNFASMPKVVAEGRRSINNIQRSATLFISKTIFSILLALLFIFITAPYPFMPIQYTLINAFTIGIPSLILALEPNKERIKGIFLFNILKNAIPAGLTIVLSIIMSVICMRIFSLSEVEYSTLSVCILTAVSMMLLFRISLPFNPLRIALFIVMNTGMLIGLLCFRNFSFMSFENINLFGISDFNLQLILIIAVLFVICLAVFLLLTFIVEKNAPAAEKRVEQRRRAKRLKKA